MPCHTQSDGLLFLNSTFLMQPIRAAHAIRSCRPYACLLLLQAMRAQSQRFHPYATAIQA